MLPRATTCHDISKTALMRFDGLIKSFTKENVDEYVLSVGCKPKVNLTDREDFVELETKHCDETLLLGFLNWAVPHEKLASLPLDEQFRFTFGGNEFTISANETEVVIRNV